MTRDEIIKARFKDEETPPHGTFKDRPVKDCMAIYAEQYAKECLDLFVSEIRTTGNELNEPLSSLIGDPYFILPDHK